jgi:hypothetical protein
MKTDAEKKGTAKSVFPYEKPRLVAILLFADQVLTTCGKTDPSVSACVVPTGSPSIS